MTTAPDGLKRWEIFNREEIHFVVTYWMMPEMNGLELIKQIRDQDEKAYCYIILLTAKNDKDEIVERISSGADDYVVKPFHKEDLAVRVRAGQRIVELQQELFEANEELKKLSVTDPLTGLYNRRALSEYLKQSEAEYRVKNISWTFIMADIDRFKKINDIYVHDAGDHVLGEIAVRNKMAVPGHDMISRIGGEEFFFVLSEIDLEQAEAITEQMRKEIEESPIVLPDKTEIFTTCSFGVFCVRPPADWNREHCMKMAVQALYESKNSGKNRVTMTVQEPE